jgi:hypothetical protein
MKLTWVLHLNLFEYRARQAEMCALAHPSTFRSVPVTVKAGSQSIAAGLMGTSLGIGLSSVLFYVVSDAQEVPYYFMMGFSALAMIHQGCTYQSLQLVPLAHFNRHRLELVLRHYLETGHVMSPAEVAPLDLQIPWLPSVSTSSSSWLSIGSPLEVVCPDSSEREQLLTTAIARRTNSNNQGHQDDQGYILYTKQNPLTTKKDKRGSDVSDPLVHLVFWEDATGADEIRGMMHAFVFRQMRQQRHGKYELPDTNRKSLVEDKVENHSSSVTSTHLSLVQEQFPKFLEQLQVQGWKTGSEFTTIESRRSHRLGMVRL